MHKQKLSVALLCLMLAMHNIHATFNKYLSPNDLKQILPTVSSAIISHPRTAGLSAALLISAVTPVATINYTANRSDETELSALITFAVPICAGIIAGTTAYTMGNANMELSLKIGMATAASGLIGTSLGIAYLINFQ